MDFNTVKNTVIRTFVALLLFFLCYLPLFATTTCDCVSSTCKLGEMKGFFLCNACNCLDPTEALIQFLLFGVVPFAIFYLVAYVLIRE